MIYVLQIIAFYAALKVILVGEDHSAYLGVVYPGACRARNVLVAAGGGQHQRACNTSSGLLRVVWSLWPPWWVPVPY